MFEYVNPSIRWQTTSTRPKPSPWGEGAPKGRMWGVMECKMQNAKCKVMTDRHGNKWPCDERTVGADAHIGPLREAAKPSPWGVVLRAANLKLP